MSDLLRRERRIRAVCLGVLLLGAGIGVALAWSGTPGGGPAASGSSSVPPASPIFAPTTNIQVGTPTEMSLLTDGLLFKVTDWATPASIDVAAPFRYDGGFPVVLDQSTTNKRMVVAGPERQAWRVTFRSNAPRFEVYLRAHSGGEKFRISVGETSSGIVTMPVGGPAYAPVALGDAEERTVSIELDGALYFGGVVVPLGFKVEPPEPASSPRVAIVGDSFTAAAVGDGGYADAHFTGWAQRLQEREGWLDVWILGQGGTGYANPGSGQVLQDRLEMDVYSAEPDVIVLASGLNDTPYSPQLVGAAARAAFTSIQKNLPRARLVVMSPFSSGTPTPQLLGVGDAIRAESLAAGAQYVDMLSDPWITGTGRSSAPTHDGNADTYIGPDGVHPTQAGHNYLGDRVADALADLP